MRLLLVALALSMAGCSSVGEGPASVTLVEGAIDVAGAVVAGPASLPVTNNGEFVHTLVVSQSDGTVVAATGEIAPGENVAIDLDLAPAEYQFTCRIVVELPDGTLVDHYAEGMVAEVTVQS